MGIPLGATISIFGLFVGIQVRYLFGGHDLITGTVGVTYAEYARRGFFEIVTAAALVIQPGRVAVSEKTAAPT